jgi:hypothetical protein
VLAAAPLAGYAGGDALSEAAMAMAMSCSSAAAAALVAEV